MTRTIEERLRATLHTKANEVRACERDILADSTEPSRRRPLILAAAEVVAIAVVAVSLATRQDRSEIVPAPAPDLAPTSASSPAPTGEPPSMDLPPSMEAVLGFLPTAGIPDGWVQASATLSSQPVLPTWVTVEQLFATTDGRTVARGVLVQSEVLERDYPLDPFPPPTLPGAPAVTPPSTLAPPGSTGIPQISDPNTTVQGVPARLSQGEHDLFPPDTVAVSWVTTTSRHWAAARGMNGEELVTFLNTLVSRADPAQGFDAAGSELVEIDASSSTPGTSFDARFVPPGSTSPDGASITVSATTGFDRSLEARLFGVAEGDDIIVRRPGNETSPASMTVTRPDGWTIGISAFEAFSAEEVSGALDTVYGGLQPVTGRQLVEQVRAMPMIETAEVQGEPVIVRGVDGHRRGLCLGDTPTSPCGLTGWEILDGSERVISWIWVDGRWTIAAAGAGAELHLVAIGPGQDDDATLPARTVTTGGRTWMLADVPEGIWHVGLNHGDAGGTASLKPVP